MKKINLVLLGLLFVSILTSCKKEEPVEPTTPIIENPGPNVSENPAVLDLGNNITSNFFARIVDENGQSVTNATVKIGNKTALTDDNGIAIISNATVKEKLAYLTVIKPGYFLGSRSVIPQPNVNSEIKITLLKKDVIATISSGSPTTVSTPSGLSIDFKGEYVKADGSVYNGNVDVAIKHINPSSDDFSNQMPGSLFAQNSENESGVLESYGMGAIEIFSPSGEELQIASGSSATLHMPVVSSQIANAPTTIPLWHFDEIAGYWIEEGEATLINGEYVGEVKHFSFWNCDDFYIDATISGTVVDVSGNTISQGSVEIVTPNATTSGPISSNGTFFSYVPANVPVIFNVTDNCGNQIDTWTNVFSPNSNISHSFSTSQNNSTVTGILLDCNNNLVSNGYVKVTLGNNTLYPSLTNGIFSFNHGNCNSSNTFTVVGYDFTNLQTSNTVTYNISNSNMNISILTCNSAAEYITYFIDNNPATTFFAPIFCTEYQNLAGDTTEIRINSFTNGEYLSIKLEGIVPGTYNYVDYGTPTPGGSIYIPDTINTSSGYPNITFNLTSYGSVGSYVDITFSGPYMDNSNVNHTISGTVHVLRDQ